MERNLESRPSVRFEVKKVIGVSSDGSYQVQWAPAWVSKFHLVGCEHLIEEFHQQQKEQEEHLLQQPKQHDKLHQKQINQDLIKDEEFAFNNNNGLLDDGNDFASSFDCPSDPTDDLLQFDANNLMELETPTTADTDSLDIHTNDNQNDTSTQQHQQQQQQLDIDTESLVVIKTEPTDPGFPSFSHRIHTPDDIQLGSDAPPSMTDIYDSHNDNTYINSDAAVYSGSNTLEFTCPLCSKTFANNGHLKRHMHTHTEHEDRKPTATNLNNNNNNNNTNNKSNNSKHQHNVKPTLVTAAVSGKKGKHWCKHCNASFSCNGNLQVFIFIPLIGHIQQVNFPG